MKRALYVVAWCLLHWCAGCASFGPPGPPRLGESQAVWIVWTSYGRTDMPPLVRWKEGAELTCTDPNSGKRGFEILDLDPAAVWSEGPLVCREGDTWSPKEVLVSWHGELSYAETALAHELEHAELLRRGIWLGHHSRPDFQARIDVANQALVDAGR